MKFQTRAQRDLKLAYECVAKLEHEGEELRKIYGGLCHSFPVLVRTAGLCQALAFSKSKAVGEGDRAKAHDYLLKHVAEILSVNDALKTVRDDAKALEYMHHTRRVLESFVYFKRFAVSVLKVKGGDDDARRD